MGALWGVGAPSLFLNFLDGIGFALALGAAT